MESIEFDEYKAVLVKNKIDGRCLMECNTVEDVVNMGITIFVKARIFLDELMKWKAEYSSANESAHDEVKSPLVSCLVVAISMAYILIVLYYYITVHICFFMYRMYNHLGKLQKSC